LAGEEQKKLDILSNDVFKDKLAKTGYPPKCEAVPRRARS